MLICKVLHLCADLVEGQLLHSTQHHYTTLLREAETIRTYHLSNYRHYPATGNVDARTLCKGQLQTATLMSLGRRQHTFSMSSAREG